MEPELMTDQMFVPDFPDGLPIGDGWVDAPQRAEIRFPFDGSLVADSPVGDVALAQRALEKAKRCPVYALT